MNLASSTMSLSVGLFLFLSRVRAIVITLKKSKSCSVDRSSDGSVRIRYNQYKSINFRRGRAW